MKYINSVDVDCALCNMCMRAWDANLVLGGKLELVRGKLVLVLDDRLEQVQLVLQYEVELELEQLSARSVGALMHKKEMEVE